MLELPLFLIVANACCVSEFFNQLNVDCGQLSFDSTVPEIVRYFKEAMLRISPT